jgi:hypothetical protein
VLTSVYGVSPCFIETGRGASSPKSVAYCNQGEMRHKSRIERMGSLPLQTGTPPLSSISEGLIKTAAKSATMEGSASFPEPFNVAELTSDREYRAVCAKPLKASQSCS